MVLIRQVASIVLLPFAVTALVPSWILGRSISAALATADPAGIPLVVGASAGMVGLALFGWSLYHFWAEGRGTLAPWDPPRRFVVSGPYRFVRNPMITGVLFVLLGEAGMLRSLSLLEWAGFFALINAIYIPLLEEPQLRARFGEPYAQYSRSVGRFIPRLTPYRS